MTSFFHSYDLRGKYPQEISETEAEKVGKAYGTFTEAEEVLVGRDGRVHGEEVTESFIKGITSTGTDVVYAGVVPTPIVYHGQVQNSIMSAAIVTASHNPPEYTGFKFCLEEAEAMSREGGMKEIQRIYEQELFEAGEGERSSIKLASSYIKAVKQNTGDLNLEIAINCGNGVTGTVSRKIFEELGCSVKVINEEVNGEFPNHLPAPGNEEAQNQLEREMVDEDLGIIFDGDGDRAGFILPGHGYIQEDEVIALFSEEALNKKKGKVVHDLRVSKLVPEIIEENGGVPEESRVGHTFISEEIHSDSEIVFAGELSGHYYFPAWNFKWDDGLFAAALMCKIASETNIKEKLESYTDYPTSPEINIECPHEIKQKVIEAIADKYANYETSKKDGVKIQFESGWALVRPSSTEPKVRIRCEADTEKDLEEILAEVDAETRETVQKFTS